MSIIIIFLRLLFVPYKEVVMNNEYFILNSNKTRRHSLCRLNHRLLCCKLKNNKKVLVSVELKFLRDVITDFVKSRVVLKDYFGNEIYDFEDVIKFKPLDYSWGKVLN
ncbi:MAG: hypothetical protein MJ221_04335 [Bacilli bacterium]|nr:hypothetical protein [Bacilli bacterium]